MRRDVLAAGLSCWMACGVAMADDAAFLESARSALESAQASGNTFVVQNVVDAYISARPDLEASIRDVYTAVVDAQDAAAEVAVPEDAAAAVADAAPEAREIEAPTGWRHGWAGNVNLGIEIERGNTEETEVNFAVDATRAFGKWATDYRLEHNFTRANTVRVEEEYLIASNLRREISGKWAWAGFLTAERDHFSGFEYRIAVGLGPSYQVFDTPATNWRVSIGPGARFDRLDGPGTEITTTPILGVDSRFRQELWGDWRFGNDFRSSFGDGQIINLLTFLETTLYKRLALRISNEIDIETDAPATAQTTDTTNTLAIVYNFGAAD
ncbi:MAG: DUF481 domain-containing protein [Pseudomonadota bacterium]